MRPALTFSFAGDILWIQHCGIRTEPERNSGSVDSIYVTPPVIDLHIAKISRSKERGNYHTLIINNMSAGILHISSQTNINVSKKKERKKEIHTKIRGTTPICKQDLHRDKTRRDSGFNSKNGD